MVELEFEFDRLSIDSRAPQAVVIMAYFQGLKYQEIADAMKIPVGNSEVAAICRHSSVTVLLESNDILERAIHE